jgi:hypothetical protein
MMEGKLESVFARADDDDLSSFLTDDEGLDEDGSEAIGREVLDEDEGLEDSLAEGETDRVGAGKKERYETETISLSTWLTCKSTERCTDCCCCFLQPSRS